MVEVGCDGWGGALSGDLVMHLIEIHKRLVDSHHFSPSF